jgi:hypothetical protein
MPFLPRPTREELATQPLHVVVRDYPEVLENLREYGVSPEEFGDTCLEDFEEPGDLLDELEMVTAWRPGVGNA